MTDKENGDSPDTFTSQEYEAMLRLDDLESLLEDLEDEGVSGFERAEEIPQDLRERMAELRVHDVQGLRGMILNLHADLDSDEGERAISES